MITGTLGERLLKAYNNVMKSIGIFNNDAESPSLGSSDNHVLTVPANSVLSEDLLSGNLKTFCSSQEYVNLTSVFNDTDSDDGDKINRKRSWSDKAEAFFTNLEEKQSNSERNINQIANLVLEVSAWHTFYP